MAESKDYRKTENKEVEKSLIFAAFKYDNNLFEIMKNIISVEDFAFPTYKQIYKVILEEYEKTNAKLSFPGFYKFIVGLPETGEDDKVKIKVALEDIKISAIKEEDVVPFCQQLKEHAHNRKLIKTLSLTSENIGQMDAADAILYLEEKLDTLKKSINVGSNIDCMSFKEDIEKRIEYLKHLKSNPEEAGIIWTGFANFDNFSPPLKRGAFAMFQARTNMGKSMFLMSVALKNYCGVYSKSFHTPDMEGKVKGVKTIIITIEMSASEYAFRMDSFATGYKHTEEFSLGHIIDDEHKIASWKKKVQEFGNNDSDLLIYWVPENCTPTVIDQIITNNPFKPDLVVIDYIGDMSSGLSGVTNYDWKAQAYLYTRIKQLAGKHRCVIFSAQQSIRGAKKLSDETGAASDKASHIADMLIAIEQTESDELKSSKEDVNGVSIEGRLTLSHIKIRSGTRLRTHIVPHFYRMNWIEDHSDTPLQAGTIKVIENKKKKDKKVLDDSEPIIKRPKLEKEPPKEAIEYEIGIEDSPVTKTSEPELDDAALEAALSEIN